MASVRLLVAERTEFQSRAGMATLQYRTLKYDRIIRRACISDGCRQQLCIQKCGQTGADRDVVTTDSLKKLVIALLNRIIANPLRRTV